MVKPVKTVAMFVHEDGLEDEIMRLKLKGKRVVLLTDWDIVGVKKKDRFELDSDALLEAIKKAFEC